MRLNFKRVEISNFLCFENEVFDFDKHKGLILICGKNLDLPGSKNGTGKCLDSNTKLNIEIDEEDFSKIKEIIDKDNGIGK